MPDAPENCGSKELLVTFDGRSVDLPCIPKFGVLEYCNHVDIDVWIAKVESMNAMLLQAWNQLMKAENERQDWTQTRKFRSWYDNVLARQEGLLETSVTEVLTLATSEINQHVAKLVSMAVDQACLLEQMRSAFLNMGGDPVKVPYVEIKPAETLAGTIQKQFQAGSAAQKVAQTTVRGVLIGATILGGLYVFRDPITRAILRGGR